MEKQLFLVLTQTSSVLSRVIKFFTKAEFNHISISLSQNLEPMWSFGRRRPYNPFWGGFVKEYPKAGTFQRFPHTRAAVLVLDISQETYDGILEMMETMYEDRRKYRYNFIGLCCAAFGICYTPDHKYYCSQFAKEVFEKFEIPGADQFEKLVQPSHFLAFPGTSLVYQGLLREYADHTNGKEKRPLAYR